MTHEEIRNLIVTALDEVAPGKSGEFQKVDIDTNIRELGIDSVAAMEMIGVVEEELEVTFDDEDLAQIASFKDLADLIARAAE